MRLVNGRVPLIAASILLCGLLLALPDGSETARAAAPSMPANGPCRSAAACGIYAPAALPISLFDTGAPDGRMAMASRSDLGGGPVEIEAADDFVVTSTVRLSNARFTGLMPTAASFATIQQVDVEVYRVFPLDSNTMRTINVPTRANSPADVLFDSRGASGGLNFNATLLAQNFIAANSVLNGIHPMPSQNTGGEGAVSGEEVQFDVTLTPTIELAAGQYFFVPQVKLSSGDFYWLSAAGPTLPGDLQAWIRNANLAPDWLRVGSDIVGGAAKFNGSLALLGTRVLKTYLPLIRR